MWFSFMTNMSIQPLWLTHFLEILLVIDFQSNNSSFSYKAHFTPEISFDEKENFSFILIYENGEKGRRGKQINPINRGGVKAKG